MNTVYFVYASFKTRAKAEAALEEFFALGEICEAERPYITHRNGRYCVMFPGC